MCVNPGSLRPAQDRQVRENNWVGTGLKSGEQLVGFSSSQRRQLCDIAYNGTLFR